MKCISSLFVVSSLVLFSSCSTLNESLQLGASTGFLSGALATYAGHSAAGGRADLETVATGAGIGLGIGLITSYLIHRSVEEERSQSAFDQTDMHFGDLPPNPFVVPRPAKKAVRK